MSSSPRFIVERRSEFNFAVLGPNPDFGKSCVSYAGQYLTVCTMDGRDEADLVAAALNAFPASRGWPNLRVVAA